MDQQVTKTTIPVEALSSIGFASDSAAVVTPKTRDIFDFETPIEKVGSTIAQVLSKQQEKPAEGEKLTEQKQEGKTPNLNVLNQIADGLHQDLKDAAKEEGSPENKSGDSQPVQGDKSDKAYKNAMVSWMKRKIEKGEFEPYSDYDESKHKLTDYLNNFTNEELEELAETNDTARQEKFKEEYRKGFKSTLPDHVQWVIENLIDGSVDPQATYAALARVEATHRMDPANEKDHTGIVRSYLEETNFGTPDEIAAQIDEWKEADTLGKKAAQFKPKLDTITENRVKYYAQEAEQAKEQQRQAAENYINSVTSSLKGLKLGEQAITKKQAETLYHTLVQDIKPSVVNGQPVNGLWQALEKIQFVKPDYGHLAKIAWLATDPKGYDEWMMQQGRNDQQAKVTRELKGQQGNAGNMGEHEQPQTVTKRGIPKPKNVFDQ